MTARLLEPPSEVEALIRTAAFRLLLAHGAAVSVTELAGATGLTLDKLLVHIEEMDRGGRIRRDGAGEVVGSAGLNVTRDRHEIELDGRRFWTWCAYDILGIFGALEATGRAVSPSPEGTTIEVQFQRGRPVNLDAVLFRPNDELLSCCENVYEEWCPNSNLFSNAERATRWAEQRHVHGRVMDLAEASTLGTADWADLI